ncbi:MAG: hypothetical protein A2V63_10045 [Candidatus Eisenbacteria bacterium RBG_19FT_COMBO_70_11]|nr:MAG: hypothetical protein A2V63_10045 [Candidatus Eisenbacteria bacterium RBG_19FT_COMBO_70_11]
MIAADRHQRLQEIADYRTVRKTLRAGGIGSLVFGALGLIGGLIPPVDFVLTAVGAALVGTGIWNILAPRPTGIIVDGLSLLMVGVYNIANVTVSVAQGETGGGSGLWIKLGIFQIVWGVQSFWRFVQFRDAFKSPATDAELLELDGMASQLWKAHEKDASDVIEFAVSGLRAMKWKCRLDPEYAFLATTGGAEVRVVSKDLFDIEDAGKVLIGKSHKAVFRIGAKTLKGTIKPESLARFQQWKIGMSLPIPIAA